MHLICHRLNEIATAAVSRSSEWQSYKYILCCLREMGIGAYTFCVWGGRRGGEVRNTLVDSWGPFH